MKRPFKPCLAGIGVALALGLAPQSSHAAENILYNCFHPPQYYTCAVIYPEMAKRIKEATDGRVTLSTPPKSLAAANEQFQGVTNGVMDGATSFTPFIAAETAGMQLPVLPFVGRANAEAASRAMYKTYHKFFAGKPGEFEHVELIGIYSINGSDIWSINGKPILSVKDIADRKMFAVAGVAANVVKLTGSSVVAGPAVQMLESIANGVVDGYAGVTWDVLQDFNTGQYTKSGTFTDRKITQPTFAMFINKDKWNKISPEDQKAIHAALGEDFSAWIGKKTDENFDKARKKWMAAGVKTYDASPEFEAEMTKLSSPLVDAWKDKVKSMGIDGDEVIAHFEKAYDDAVAAMKSN